MSQVLAPCQFPVMKADLLASPSFVRGARSERSLQLLSWRIDPHSRQDLTLLVCAFLVFHVLLWTILPAISHRAPPWDNIEQLVWTQSLEWGYYKHPPAPTWWMFGWTHLFGRHLWVTFFAAQLSVAFMMFAVWRIALGLTTPVRAFAAVVLTSLLAYHGLRGIMANHNTLQLMPVGFLLLATLAAVRAMNVGGWRAWGLWVLVGAVSALCLLSKYSAVIAMASLGLWMLLDARMRSLRAWMGVALALLVCVLLMLPHLMWLKEAGFPTLRYANKVFQGDEGSAMATAANHWVDLRRFAAAQLGRVLPMVLGLLALRFVLRRDPALPVRHQGSMWGEESRFVWVVGLGPLLMTLVLGALGVHLMSSWATTFFVLFGVLALRWVPQVEPACLLKAVVVVGLTAELVLAGGLALGRGVLVDSMGRASRSNFPAQALASALTAQWSGYIQSPLRVVVGDTWLAGNVSLHTASQPLVFIDGDLSRAPWINPAMLNSCDLLVLVDRSPGAVKPSPQTLEYLGAAAVRGQVELPWTSKRRGPVLKVEWGIVPAERPGCVH